MQSPKDPNTFNVKDFLQKCLGHWWWFLISLVICMGAGVYVILTTQPVYSHSATILIKETSVRRQSSADLETILGTGGLNSANSKIANEVVAFRSTALMEDVIRRYKLNISYIVEDKRYDHDIYGAACPISVCFPGLDDEMACALDVRLKGFGQYELDNFSIKGKKVEGPKMPVCAGDTVITPVGLVCITPRVATVKEMEECIKVSHRSMRATTQSFSKRLVVEMEDMKNFSDVLNLSFSDVNLERVDDVLTGLIDIYNENWVNDRNRIATATSHFIDERLSTLDKDLNVVDSDISSFKSRNLVPDIDAVSTMYMTRQTQNETKIQELENQLYVSQYILNYLHSPSSKDLMIPVSGNLSNTGISAQITEYNEMLLKRNKLVANSSTDNPLIREMDRSLESLRAAVENSVEILIETQKGQLEALGKRADNNTARIADNPNQEKYLLGVGRQQKVKEALYLFLLQKREENELSQAFTAYNTRVITPPTGSNRPISPAKQKILLIALVLALAIPVAIIYALDALDTTVRGRKDLEGLKIPLLGEIPQYYKPGERHRRKTFLGKPIGDIHGKDDGSKQFFLVKHGSRNTVNEAFRVLRTNIEFVTSYEEGKVLLFTSFNVGAGKTFTCANLGVALNVNGAKVLEIDCDLRHASLSCYADSPAKGITDYIAGKVKDIDEVIVKNVGETTMDLIPVGSIPPNPSELLSSQRFTDLIAGLKQKYEYILLDCPPIEIVADTQIVEKVADRSIFVIRAGLFSREMLPELDNLYEENKFKKMMLVLNGSGAEGTYYGRYGYYGHYGYYGGKKSHYGYYSKDEE